MPQINTQNTEEEPDLLEIKEEIWEKSIELIEEVLKELEEGGLEIDPPIEEKALDKKEGISLEHWGEEDKKKNKNRLIYYLDIHI